MDKSKDEEFPTILVMLGATGDLSKRKLIPALWDLYQGGNLPELFQIVGISRDEMTDEAWREWVRDVVTTKCDDKVEIDKFVKKFVYQTGLFEDKETYQAVAKKLGRQDDQWKSCANKLFYLAVPPPFYQTIFQNLAESGLTEPCSEDEGWTRVVVEKPFGKDLATAQELDAKLGELFQEEQIYRIDHYLGKDTVRNILAFRFSNTFLGPAWNSKSIDNIHIKMWETGDAADRGSYYDGVGALRDVGQNHLLQLLALFTMENPVQFDAESIRERRAELLEMLEVMDGDDVVKQTVRGQYAGYSEADGVANKSDTETYFKVKTHINSTRWRGVPMILESGKALKESMVEATVTFRHQTPCLCPPDAAKHYTNVLTYRVQPHEGTLMSFWVKRPGPDMVIEEKQFSFDYEHEYGNMAFVDAYAKLLLDVIQGDQTLFVSTREIMRSWYFVDPIERVWKNGSVPLQIYERGTEGPDDKVLKYGADKQIGYIGLGKMGSNMVERLVDHKWSVVATDPSSEARQKMAKYGAKVKENAVEAVKSLSAPRIVWLMVPHQAVDDVLEEIRENLEAGDIVIDGGNSNYKESVRRAKKMKNLGVYYLDVGVSGGPSGARGGACLMVGGDKGAYKQMTGLFNDLATGAGYDYMGGSGSGHFVKMVHNGIEYGMMQAIGEGFEVMRGFGDLSEGENQELDLAAISRLYNHGSVIESSLVGWLKDAYEAYGLGLDDVSGEVSHSGEGQWTVEAAKELGVPVPIIEGALKFRVESQGNSSYTGQVVSALRNMFGGHSVSK